MSYIADLEDNVAKAEKYVAMMEECAAAGHWTAHNFIGATLRQLLKSVQFCIGCAHKKRCRLEEKRKEGVLPEDAKFTCVGGCIRSMSLERQVEITRKLQYINTLFPGLRK